MSNSAKLGELQLNAIIRCFEQWITQVIYRNNFLFLISIIKILIGNNQ